MNDSPMTLVAYGCAIATALSGTDRLLCRTTWRRDDREQVARRFVLLVVAPCAILALCLLHLRVTLPVVLHVSSGDWRRHSMTEVGEIVGASHAAPVGLLRWPVSPMSATTNTAGAQRRLGTGSGGSGFSDGDDGGDGGDDDDDQGYEGSAARSTEPPIFDYESDPRDPNHLRLRSLLLMALFTAAIAIFDMTRHGEVPILCCVAVTALWIALTGVWVPNAPRQSSLALALFVFDVMFVFFAASALRCAIPTPDGPLRSPGGFPRGVSVGDDDGAESVVSPPTLRMFASPRQRVRVTVSRRRRGY
jgi:hypothetical protein